MAADVPAAAWRGLAVLGTALGVAAAAALLSPPDARWEGALLAGLLAWAGVIDARSFVLPNLITGLIVATGLALAAVDGWARLIHHAIGAAAGYAAFAVLSLSYRRVRGRDGLGLGDAKLFAGAGAWLGWAGLPLASLIAAGAGLAHFGVLALRGRTIDAATPIPFGPHLCVAIWLVWRFAPDRFL